MNREDIIKTNSGIKLSSPKCPVCKQVYKHHKFLGGKMIKNICNCNINLLDEEANRIIQNQKVKIETPNYRGVKTITINLE